jgi:hypothetical protein
MNHLKAEIEHFKKLLHTLQEKHGYALESIRQLVQLAEENEVDAAVCVRVARRFLKESEGAK